MSWLEIFIKLYVYEYYGGRLWRAMCRCLRIEFIVFGVLIGRLVRDLNGFNLAVFGVSSRFDL